MGMTTARPVHPGEVLREEFLAPLGLSAGAVAAAVAVPRTRIERVRDEQTAVTADTALRLGSFFGTSPDFWLNLQTAHDLTVARGDFRDAIEPFDGPAPPTPRIRTHNQ